MEEDEVEISIDSNDCSFKNKKKFEAKGDDMTDVTLPFNEEEDNVIAKKPISSKKSKSLENINQGKNAAKQRTARALLEMYKQLQDKKPVEANDGLSNL